MSGSAEAKEMKRKKDGKAEGRKDNRKRKK